MRFMYWSYSDLCLCPESYKDVLIDMLQEEVKEREHQAVLAEARATRRR